MNMFAESVSKTPFDQPIWERQMRINAATLRLGHYVSNMDVAWQNSPFKLQGVLLKNRKQLSWFQEHCHWVVIDLHKSQARNKGYKPQAYSLTEHKTPVNKNSMKNALKSYVGLEREVSDIIGSLRSNRFISAGRTKEAIHTVAKQLFDHGPALIWLTHIKSKDNYTAEHCLNVAILAMGLAHSLGWKKHEVQEAGLAGLLHDVGKTLIPEHILNKAGQLSEAEFEIMQQHTTRGYEIISRDAELPDSVKNAALHHHERPDGKGYPYKLVQHQIKDIAALISVVDAYDAITSNRCYQKARNHHLALGILWKGRDTQFDAQMVEAFIQWIGWVSPGTVVRLTNGEKAIVILANAGNRLQPTVRLLIEEGGETRLSDAISLSTAEDSNGQPVYISKVLDSCEADVDIRNLSRQILVSNP